MSLILISIVIVVLSGCYVKDNRKAPGDPASGEPEVSAVEGPVKDEPEVSAVEGPVKDDPEVSAVEGPVKDEPDVSSVEEPVTCEPEVSAVEAPANDDPAVSSAENGMGNTNGNIRNGGFAAIQGDWIYYSFNGMKKMRTDGSESTLVADVDAEYLNVAGDWIYYSEYVPYSDGMEACELFKIKTDGTEKTILTEDPAYFVHVLDGWVYYTQEYVDCEDWPGIYRIKTDGTGREQICEDGSGICIEDGWIYFSCADAFAPGGIDRIRPDGSQRETVSDRIWSGFLVYDGWIYGWTADDPKNDESWRFCRMRTDGSGLEELDYAPRGFNKDGGAIYYYDKETFNSDRFLKPDDYLQAGVVDFSLVYSPNITGDWVFFIANKEGGVDQKYDVLCRARKDGTGFEVVAEREQP